MKKAYNLYENSLTSFYLELLGVLKCNSGNHRKPKIFLKFNVIQQCFLDVFG